MRNAERRNGIRYPESLESPVPGNRHAGFGRGTLEKGRKAPRQRPTSPSVDYSSTRPRHDPRTSRKSQLLRPRTCRAVAPPTGPEPIALGIALEKLIVT